MGFALSLSSLLRPTNAVSRCFFSWHCTIQILKFKATCIIFLSKRNNNILRLTIQALLNNYQKLSKILTVSNFLAVSNFWQGAVEKLEVNFSESADNTQRLKIRRKKTHAIIDSFNTERDMCPRVLSGGNKLSEKIRAPGFDPDTMPNSTYHAQLYLPR